MHLFFFSIYFRRGNREDGFQSLRQLHVRLPVDAVPIARQTEMILPKLQAGGSVLNELSKLPLIFPLVWTTDLLFPSQSSPHSTSNPTSAPRDNSYSIPFISQDALNPFHPLPVPIETRREDSFPLSSPFRARSFDSLLPLAVI